jgi:type II secretory pathway pseudopilin PulG
MNEAMNADAKKRFGFTALLELVVVMAILVVLAGLVILEIGTSRKEQA